VFKKSTATYQVEGRGANPWFRSTLKNLRVSVKLAHHAHNVKEVVKFGYPLPIGSIDTHEHENGGRNARLPF
jgi:hypothetical protein